jgi:hypothetical protein
VIGSAASGFGALEEADDQYQVVVVRGDNEVRDKVLRIVVEGAIAEQSSPVIGASGGTVSRVERALKLARRDDTIKGVLLAINSPGGGVTDSDLIYRAIKTFRDETGKPVVAHFGDLAASGGYYIACACEQILASSTTITGSIGVVLSTWNYVERLLEALLSGKLGQRVELQQAAAPRLGVAARERHLDRTGEGGRGQAVLGDDVDRAVFQQLVGQVRIALAGDEDDGGRPVGIDRLDRVHDLGAFAVAETVVEQDAVEVLSRDRLAGGCDRFRLVERRRHAGLLQQAAHLQAVDRLVLDQQQPGAGGIGQDGGVSVGRRRLDDLDVAERVPICRFGDGWLCSHANLSSRRHSDSLNRVLWASSRKDRSQQVKKLRKY